MGLVTVALTRTLVKPMTRRDMGRRSQYDNYQQPNQQGGSQSSGQRGYDSGYDALRNNNRANQGYENQQTYPSQNAPSQTYPSQTYPSERDKPVMTDLVAIRAMLVALKCRVNNIHAVATHNKITRSEVIPNRATNRLQIRGPGQAYAPPGALWRKICSQ